MAAFNLAALLGIKKPSRSQSARNPDTKDNKTMFDFSHLKPGASNVFLADEQPADQDINPQRTDDDSGFDTVDRPEKHSREHNVAVSDEAQGNPVLAIRLLKETDLSSKKIKAQLTDAPEALSKFTQGHMEENDPTWEFQDEDEQARTAMVYSTQNDDQNGYLAAKARASKSLAKMVEPMTQDEMQALVARTQQIINASDPDTPDNVDARRQADEEYKQALAKAMAKRNAAFRATGVQIPGNDNQNDEAEKIKAQLDSQMSDPRTGTR